MITFVVYNVINSFKNTNFMALYYVTKNPIYNGKHEVHCASCKKLPPMATIISLGDFKDCIRATKEAKKYFTDIDGCLLCCRQCHKK